MYGDIFILSRVLYQTRKIWLYIELKRDGAVVRPHDIGMNLGSRYMRYEGFASEKVVDTPSDVACTRVRKMTPPRVVSVSLSEYTEGINKSGIDNRIYPFALFLGKALFTLVRLRIRQIILGMGNIEVPAKDYRFFFL